MTHDDLLEKVAAALFNYRDPPGQSLWGIERSRDKARAAIALCMEEAARSAEVEKFTSDTLTPAGEAHNRACDIIAAAIRALAKE